MTITQTVEFTDGNWIDVEFEGFPTWENDSFDYAGTHCTGGMSGTCHLPSYATMSDSEITWDMSKYTPSENAGIVSWLATDKNEDELNELFCYHLEK